jgi:hypothetical protein
LWEECPVGHLTDSAFRSLVVLAAEDRYPFFRLSGRRTLAGSIGDRRRNLVTVKLNKKALEQAKSLIRQGKVVRDERDDWSEAAPTAAKENAFLEKHGFAEYSKWHLGVDDEKPDDTKGHYSFPYGDFTKVRRGGVISLESRAAQNDHDDIAKATKQLLEQIDKAS